MLPDSAETPIPHDRPGADRSAVLRVLCGGMTLGLGVVTAIAVMVVQFALDGQPIAGNAVQFAGLSAVSWAALGLAIAAPVIGLTVAAAQTRAGVDKLAADHSPAEADTDRTRLLDVFAAVVFIEYAVAEGTGVLCALLYHLTADAAVLVGVGIQLAFMVLRFPTNARVRRWHDEAAGRLADLREMQAH
jgi:hypothetical protein